MNNFAINNTINFTVVSTKSLTPSSGSSSVGCYNTKDINAVYVFTIFIKYHELQNTIGRVFNRAKCMIIFLGEQV